MTYAAHHFDADTLADMQERRRHYLARAGAADWNNEPGIALMWEKEAANCEQGTPEWLAARAGIPTASEFSCILASGRGGGDGINVRQGKTGAVLWVPFTARLREVLRETPKIGVTICAHGLGKPMAYNTAAKRVLAVRDEIGARDYDIHSLRYSAAAELAQAGCSDELIAAVTGHATAAMVRKYAGPARQKVRAIEAQERRK